MYSALGPNAANYCFDPLNSFHCQRTFARIRRYRAATVRECSSRPEHYYEEDRHQCGRRRVLDAANLKKGR